MAAAVAVGLLALAAAGCGGGGGATITADGSSTVGPFTTKAVEDFTAENQDVQITVGISGTGGGFERFCAGETDISNASRAINKDEIALCEQGGVEYVELQIATDALTNVVNPQNDWATCLTVEQLRRIWEPDSEVTTGNQVDPSYPDVTLRLYGADEGSGTFGYFKSLGPYTPPTIVVPNLGPVVPDGPSILDMQSPSSLLEVGTTRRITHRSDVKCRRLRYGRRSGSGLKLLVSGTM